ncbi:MAG: CoA transferase, partial [Candidatus Fonsibacter sp.]
MNNLKLLVEILNKEMIKKTSKEWLMIFDQKGLPCGPINTIEEMFEDSHTKHREMIVAANNTNAGIFKSIGMPIKFSKSKSNKSKAAPIFGEHTKEVLLDYGFSKSEIDNLIKNKIIYSSFK